jgi:hypothetical protein
VDESASGPAIPLLGTASLFCLRCAPLCGAFAPLERVRKVLYLQPKMRLPLPGRPGAPIDEPRPGDLAAS